MADIKKANALAFGKKKEMHIADEFRPVPCAYIVHKFLSSSFGNFKLAEGMCQFMKHVKFL